MDGMKNLTQKQAADRKEFGNAERLMDDQRLGD